MNEMYRRRKAPRRKAKVVVKLYRRRFSRNLRNQPAWLYVCEMITVILLATLSLDDGGEIGVTLLQALSGYGS